jgi:hypothetical protein
MQKKLRGPNKWKRLDDRFTNIEPRLKRAHKAGYAYLSEAIVKEYRTHRSTIEVAKVIGMTPNGIRLALVAFGETLAPRGGRRKGATLSAKSDT